MASPARSKVKELFGEALRLSPAARAEFLARVCGDDAELRAEVAGLLEAHDQSEGFLQEPPPSEGPGTRIGHYKLLELIGEGGFGAVFMAEQEEPIRRRVALKLLKPGMDSRQVIARFEAERQALALMDHPNIARVLDAGTTSTGRPYFVMELVRGVPITQYCDQAHLSTAERLSVFVPVCRAVQHAHQKGIIHRDLKPTNVLVTLHDGKPVPKVIDFGIAKATEQRLTERTLFTGFGQMIGTPAYMSPEQAEMSGLDIDTRSDVYSLGVLLYELLAGAPPFDPERLKSAGMAEILRIIKEEEPPRPSTRVSTLGSVLPSVAARRAIEPKKLGALLRGDLDWVVMKALAKERHRRYDSASTLGQDVERYLADEPVSAGPPSFAYRATKFVRRNRVGVGAGVLIVLALIGGMTGTTLGLVRARDAERKANANAKDAERKFEIAREGADLLLNNVVRELPKIPGTRELAKNVLDAALEHYEKLAAEKPDDFDEQRRIWIAFQELGDAYVALGEKDKARAAHERFHELVAGAAAANPANRRFQLDLAISFERAGTPAFSDGRIAEAAAAFEQERAILERLAAESPDDVVAQQALATCYGWTGRLELLQGHEKASVEWHEQERAILERLVAAAPRNAGLLRELSMTLERLSESASDPRPLFDRAAALDDEIAALEGDTPLTLRARAFFLNQRARYDMFAGHYAEAGVHARAAKEILDRLVAAEPRNPLFQLLVTDILQTLADDAYQTGQLEECRGHVAAAYAIASRLNDADGASVELLFGLARSCARIADLAERAGEVAEASESLDRAVDLYDRLLEMIPKNRDYMDGAATNHQRLGVLRAQVGDVDGARVNLDKSDELIRRALEMQRDDDHFQDIRVHTVTAMSDVAFASGDFALADKHAQAALAVAERLVEEHPEVPAYAEALAMVLDRLGNSASRRVDLEEETRLRRRSLETLERVLTVTPQNALTQFNHVNCLTKLSDVLAQQGRSEESDRLCSEALERTRALVAAEPSSPRFAFQLARLLQMTGDALQRDGDVERARESYTEMFAVMKPVVEREPLVDYYRSSLAKACEELAGTYRTRDDALAREWMVRSLAERRRLADSADANAVALNDSAWALLTCDPADLRDSARALEYAQRAARLNGGSDVATLDTLALAYFANGDIPRAVETQERAVDAVGTQDAARRARFESRLERYRSGLSTRVGAAASENR